MSQKATHGEGEKVATCSSTNTGGSGAPPSGGKICVDLGSGSVPFVPPSGIPQTPACNTDLSTCTPGPCMLAQYLDPMTRPDLTSDVSDTIFDYVNTIDPSLGSSLDTLHGYMCALNRCGVSNDVLTAYAAAYEHADNISVIGTTGEPANDCVLLKGGEFTDML
jgi:hypothetical protein